MDRPSAPFTVFYRTHTAEGGYTCQTCGERRHDTFARASDVFAIAARHLNVCRAPMRQHPIEGLAILDGAPHGVVLREGLMTLALPAVFGGVATRWIC